MLSLALLFVSLLSNVLVAKTEQYFAMIDRMVQCPGSEGLLIKANSMSLAYLGDDIYAMSFNLSLNQDLDRPLDIKFEVQKCGSEQGPCEDFVNHTIEDVCTELESESSIVGVLTSMVTETARCPFKKGTVAVDKAHLKIPEELLTLGTYGNYWKFKFFVMKERTPLLCLYFEGKIAKVFRAKKRRKGRKPNTK